MPLARARCKHASHEGPKTVFMKNIIMALNSFFLLSISTVPPTIRSLPEFVNLFFCEIQRWMCKGAVGCCFLLTSVSRFVDVFRILFFFACLLLPFESWNKNGDENDISVVCGFLCTFGRWYYGVIGNIFKVCLNNRKEKKICARRKIPLKLKKFCDFYENKIEV